MVQNRDARPRASFLGLFRSLTTLQVAIAFAAFGVLSAFLVTPSANKMVYQTAFLWFSGDDNVIDQTTTASVVKPKPGPTVRYTERRTIMHQPSDPPCIIYENGTRSGKCFGN